MIFRLVDGQSMCEIQGEAKKKCSNVFIPALIQDIEIKSMEFESGLYNPRCGARHCMHRKHWTMRGLCLLGEVAGMDGGYCRAFTWHEVEYLEGRMDSQVCPFILLSDVLMFSFISFLRKSCFPAQHRQCIRAKIHPFKVDFLQSRAIAQEPTYSRKTSVSFSDCQLLSISPITVHEQPLLLSSSFSPIV